MNNNPYDTIFDKNENENPGQERLSPCLSINSKVNSYPEINTNYPNFSIGDSIKRNDNEIVNNNLEENKTSKINFKKL